MGFTANKGKSSSEGWGMGFLFVFFPEDHETNNKKKSSSMFSSSPSSSFKSSSTSSPLSSFSPSSFSPSPTSSPFKRTNSTTHLLSRAQSTISICALLIFITLLLFTLSTFEPNSHFSTTPRRQLSLSPIRRNAIPASKFTSNSSSSQYALQGMGTLYRRGTRAMNDLIVAHAVESLSLHELKLFLRLLHRSGLPSRSDILFIFRSKSPDFDATILEENDSFLKLLEGYSAQNSSSAPSFDVSQFRVPERKEKQSGEPIWGRRIRSNSSLQNETERTRLSYGSVVGFEADELDPENSLAGFLDHVPMSLRRWACYPMLLGRLRRNFKHVMLVDAKEMLLLGDPLSRVRSKSPETVFLSELPSTPTRHGKRNSEKAQPSHHRRAVNPGIIMGGARGVRRLSNAMLTEIVRAAMQHKKKNSVPEQVLFTQLVGNEFILMKNVNLVTSAESIPELSSLVQANPESAGSHRHLSISKHTVARRGNSNSNSNTQVVDLNFAVLRHFCSFPLDSTVYSDC